MTQLDQLQRTLGSLEAKVDMLLDVMKTNGTHNDEVDLRLRSLETDLARFKTVASVGAFLLTSFASIFPVLWSYGSK